MATQIKNGEVFQLYDLSTSPDILERQTFSKKWAHLKNHARNIASLRMIENSSRIGATQTAKIEWGIGDPFSESETLVANLAYNATTIDLTYGHHQAQDMFFVYDPAIPAWAVVRLGTLVGTVGGGYRYNCSILKYITTTPTFSYTTSVVVKTAAAVKFADQAREYLNAKGDIGQNIIQRSRTTYGKSIIEQSVPSLIDNTLEHLVLLGYEHEARKLNKALFTNTVAIGLGSSTQAGYDYGVMGGFPYFFNPHDATFSDSNGVRTAACDGYYGVNRVFATSGGAITYDALLEWAEELSEVGGDDRFLVMSPYMYRKLLTALQNQIVIEREDYSQVVPTFADAWVMNKIDLGFLRFWLIVDRGISGIPMLVKDDENASVVADPYNWMVAHDPSLTHFLPQKTKDGVVHDMRTVSVETTNNDDIEKIEIEYAYSLGIIDPRSGGFFGTKAV